MNIVGKRIYIKPLEVEHVFQMRDWGYHKNPLLENYNFPILSDSGIQRWYNLKTKSIFDRYYGIFNKAGMLIGYMGIKNIKWIRKESTLGIVFDPNYVDKGYGNEALRCFLSHYFGEMKMKRMYLEVAEFNKRAYRLYEKIGFVAISYYLDEFFDPHLDLKGSYYLESKSCFVITEQKIYNYIYMMRLDKQDFLNSFNDI